MMNPNTGFILIPVLANIGNEWCERKRVLPLADIKTIRELNDKDGYTPAVIEKIEDDLMTEGEQLWVLETYSGLEMTIVASESAITQRLTKGNKL
jgi:hypothetical protein